MSTRASIFIILPLLLLAAPGAAHAYVDPGMGGMFYQVLVMVGAAAAGALAIFRNKIKAFFGKKNQDHERDS